VDNSVVTFDVHGLDLCIIHICIGLKRVILVVVVIQIIITYIHIYNYMYIHILYIYTLAGVSCPPQMKESAVSTVTLTEISLPLTVSNDLPFLLGRTDCPTTW
jgi:hypothetical protein